MFSQFIESIKSIYNSEITKNDVPFDTFKKPEGYKNINTTSIHHN